MQLVSDPQFSHLYPPPFPIINNQSLKYLDVGLNEDTLPYDSSPSLVLLTGARPMIKEHAPVTHRSQTLRVVASGALSDVGRSLGDHSPPARHGFKTINSTPQHSALSVRMESIAAHLPNLKDQTPHLPTPLGTGH